MAVFASGLGSATGRIFFYAFRWRSLLLQGIKFLDVFHAGNSGQMVNTWVPSRAGIFVRGMMISQEYDIPLAKVMPSILVERWFEAMMRIIAFTGMVLLLTSRDFSLQTMFIMLALILVFLAVIIGLARYQSRIIEVWPQKLAKLPGVTVDKVERMLSALLAGLVGVASTRHLVMTFLLSVIMWTVSLGYHYGVLAPLNVHFNTTEMLGLTIGSLAIVPSSTATKPVIYQGMIVLVLSFFGFDPATLTVYAILLHIPQLIWITVLGLWGVFSGPKINLKGLLTFAESYT